MAQTAAEKRAAAEAEAQQSNSADESTPTEQVSDGVDLSAGGTGQVVDPSKSTVWDDKDVPDPNARKSLAEDPTGKANAKLVGGKKK